MDSEVLFRLYEQSNDLEQFVTRLKYVSGRMTIVWADLEFPDYVYIAKANNPLELAYIPEYNVLAYASTNEILNVGFKHKIERIEVKPNTLLRVNTKTLNMKRTKFNIKEPSNRFSFNSKLGIETDNYVSGYVPRYSFRDSINKQTSLFKNTKASDGSRIRKIK